MNTETSPALNYFPVYVGLFAALTLAAICNAFLDIQYGAFGFEVLLWSLLFALTLWRGWRQQGEVSAGGKKAQKVVLLLGLLLTVVLFIPMWGFPRAGLALLLMLQAAQNCVSVTRRQLHLGLLVSLVAVMFAASHFRADWTLLFYLLPYIVAVVFTLVCEQINRRTHEVRREGLKLGVAGGQGAAIAFATSLILLCGGLLYSVTPQVSWPNLFWSYGQPGNVGQLGDLPGFGPANSSGGDVNGGTGQSEAGGQGQPADGSEAGGGLSIADMREAARRPGMPGWQASSINALADMAEGVGQLMQPIRLQLGELWQAIKEWLAQHQQAVTLAALALVALALLVAARKFIQELRPIMWLRVQADYIWLVHLRLFAARPPTALHYYAAMQRLFDLHELERPPAANTREYLTSLSQQFWHLRIEVKTFTDLFEQARYGNRALTGVELARMGSIYRYMYQHVDVLNDFSRSSARQET
jgi:hypothetical protein